MHAVPASPSLAVLGVTWLVVGIGCGGPSQASVSVGPAVTQGAEQSPEPESSAGVVVSDEGASAGAVTDAATSTGPDVSCGLGPPMPTPEEHLRTYGCLPCPCACRDGVIVCAPCAACPGPELGPQ